MGSLLEGQRDAGGQMYMPADCVLRRVRFQSRTTLISRLAIGNDQSSAGLCSDQDRPWSGSPKNFSITYQGAAGMRERWIFLLPMLLLGACGGREESPHATAAVVSGLSVEKRADVVEHREQWNKFNGDGEAWIVIQLDDSSYRTASSEAMKLSYKVISESDIAFQDVVRQSRGVTNGLYRLELGGSAFSYSLSVLDARTRRLIVRVVES
ncbi:MAG TPA: hypothetical protein VFT45_02260 [Longimicrobium sp.]|nr:hypothetical protein [Longimicrobium sp.]